MIGPTGAEILPVKGLSKGYQAKAATNGRFPYIPYINGNNFSSFHEPNKCALFSGYNLSYSGYNLSEIEH
jgi:hypothetical protein